MHAPATLLMLVLALPVQAVTLRLCVDERSHLPFVTPKGEGIADVLVREAAREVGIALEYRAAPIARCREELRVNVADAFPMTPYTTALLGFVAYPMNGSEADPGRAVTSARAMVFRRVGSKVDWNGSAFAQLTAPVLLQFGSVLLLDRVKAMNVAIDDSGKTLDANFAKLLAGRGDLAIGSEFTGQVLLAQPQFNGKIEALPLPFTDEPYYLGISRRFRDANPQLTERLWEAIARIRHSPAYQRTVQKAVEDALRTLKE